MPILIQVYKSIVLKCFVFMCNLIMISYRRPLANLGGAISQPYRTHLIAYDVVE